MEAANTNFTVIGFNRVGIKPESSAPEAGSSILIITLSIKSYNAVLEINYMIMLTRALLNASLFFFGC